MTKTDALTRFEELLDDIINDLPPEEARKVLKDISDRIKEVEE